MPEAEQVTACGEDDGTANRTPSAWMISFDFLLAHRQIVFLVWVTFGERKWSILAERRRRPASFVPILLTFGFFEHAGQHFLQ